MAEKNVRDMIRESAHKVLIYSALFVMACLVTGGIGPALVLTWAWLCLKNMIETLEKIEWLVLLEKGFAKF